MAIRLDRAALFARLRRRKAALPAAIQDRPLPHQSRARCLLDCPGHRGEPRRHRKSPDPGDAMVSGSSAVPDDFLRSIGNRPVEPTAQYPTANRTRAKRCRNETIRRPRTRSRDAAACPSWAKQAGQNLRAAANGICEASRRVGLDWASSNRPQPQRSRHSCCQAGNSERRYPDGGGLSETKRPASFLRRASPNACCYPSGERVRYQSDQPRRGTRPDAVDAGNGTSGRPPT